MELIQIVILCCLVFLIFGVVAAVVMNKESKKREGKLAVIRGSSISDGGYNERDVQNRRRAEIARKLKETKEEENKGKKKVSIALKLGQAGLEATPKQFWIFSVLCGIACTGGAYFFGMSEYVVGLMPIIGTLGVPRFVLRFLIKRRQKKFLEEFADALEAIVRLLKAGMPVSEAVSMISREFEGPVGEEMSRVYDKQKIGIPLHEAALDATKRMPLTEMQMFATGLAIQAQTGSSLSEVLTNLANVIRARFRLKRKIMALSSEAIASASIIGALPVLVATGLYFLNPDYLMILFTTPTGKMLVAGALVWMSIGIFVMKAMINFRV
ncbi:MAG: type II secretion system F family protein [Rhodospirillales bacterium]|nr:type II secretion system F family protein [Alphaproteobacteria bacterium]MCB1838710.1 type II secretion system F family protein [Alphaproteobacteria bacterium]MCB9977642.1 type II secretion system F family protein [Rhodospirillales bacterium]